MKIKNKLYDNCNQGTKVSDKFCLLVLDPKQLSHHGFKNTTSVLIMADPGVKCRQIGEGVNLYSEAIKGPPATYRYWIEPIGFHKITFTFNFEGSKNFELYETTASGDSQLQAVVTSNPFEKSSVVTCRQENIRKGGSLSMSMSWVLEEPDEEFCSKYKKQFESKISGVIHNAQRIFRTGLSGSEIQQLCGGHKLNFVDTSFPPIDESLYKTSESTSGGDASDADAGSKRKTIVWRRPSEFLEGEFQVFEDPIEPNDIKQGQVLNNIHKMFQFFA